MTAGPVTAGLRRLLLTVAFVAMLGTGTLDVVPRVWPAAAAPSATPGGGPTGVGRPGGLPARTDAPAPRGALGVRTPPVPAAPTSLGSADGPPPGAGLLVTLHPVARAPARALTSALTGRPAGAPGSRAPPVTAGTDVSLPARP